MKRYLAMWCSSLCVLFGALAFSLSLQAAAPTCGLTIITHGFQGPNFHDPFPAWPHSMAQAIIDRTGAAIPIYRVWFDPNTLTVSLLDGATSIDIRQSGGAIILLDWSDVSWDPITFSAQSVADYFFDYLFGQPPIDHSLAEIPIHMIGHSRGCSLNARLAYRLALNGILVDQVTTLDPHPANADLVPATYINVLFADNYWQAHWDSFPNGRVVPGAFNQDLSSVLTTSRLADPAPHTHVHTYYHGTIDLAATADGGDTIETSWYQNTFPRDETGYNFSRYTNPLLTRPSSGINQFISGVGGTGSRVSVDSLSQLWSNAGFDQRSTIPSVVTVGQTIDIPYYFADRNSAQTITFYTDADTNPYNGYRSQIGSVNQSSRPAGSIGTAILPWTPTVTDVGTHFIRIKGANASNARYDYILKPITVQTAQTPAPTISSVTPLTLNTLPLPQTQLITIAGTGFTSGSRLTFNDGVSPPFTDRVPASWTATQLTYNIAVGPNQANWTVRVINGGQQSNLGTFTVLTPQSPSMSLNYSGTAIPNGDQSPTVAKGTDFGTIVYGFHSPTKTFTVSNNGNSALNLTGIPRVQFGGNNASDFYMTALPSTPVGANGGSTTFQLVFEPTVNTGLRSATVTIANDDPNKNPYTFMVQGTAVIQMRVDPSLEYNGAESLNGDQSPTVSKGTDFGSADVGSQSPTHLFRFYNYGTISMPLTGSLVELSGGNGADFAIVSMPASPIAAGQYSTIGIRFQPTGSGLRTASMLIYYDATYGLGATSPYTVALRGTGTGTTTHSISLSGNMAFGNVTVGTSAQSTMTITNTGNSTLTVTNISYPSGFSGNWSGTIPVNGSQNVIVTFSPTAAIGYLGTSLTVNSDATSGFNVLAVAGTGVTGGAPTRIIYLSGVLAFNSVTVGSSAQITLTIYNDGNSTMTVTNISYPIGFSGNWSGTIPASGSQAVIVTFSPSAATSYGGTVTVNSDITSGTNTKAISGTGTLPPNQLTQMTLSNGVFRFVLNGPVGSNYVIQMSSNFVDWLPISTNIIPVGGSIVITDPNMAGQPRRFYRAVLTNITSSVTNGIASGLNSPSLLVLDGGNIYFTDNTASDGIIKSVSKTGGSATTLFTGATIFDSGYYRGVGVLQAYNSTLYGHYGGYEQSKVFSGPESGGSLTTLITISGGSFIGVIGSDAFYSSGFNSLNKIPNTGGTATPLLNGYWVRSTAFDNGAIYFVEYFSKDVKKYTISSGTLSTLIGGNSDEGTVFIDNANLYLNIGGNIKMVSKTGGSATTLVSSTGANGYASDGTRVYYTENNVIKSILVVGGTPLSLISPPTNSLTSVAVDESFIYWTDVSGGAGAGKILRMAKPGP